MTILVFVYGTLKKGYGNHSVLGKSSVFRGEAAISGAKMINLGAYPAIIDGDEEIHGEIYEVSPATMDKLDRLEGHPHFYERRKVKISDSQSAWVYFLSKGYTEEILARQFPHIPGGVWPQK